MWMAIPDMDDKELAEARQEMRNRLQAVTGHNRAARYEERLRQLDAEAESRKPDGGNAAGYGIAGDPIVGDQAQDVDRGWVFYDDGDEAIEDGVNGQVMRHVVVDGDKDARAMFWIRGDAERYVRDRNRALSDEQAVIVNEQVVELSDGMYRALCGLVHPADAIDPATVTASDEDWAALRALFPLNDAHTIEDEV